MNGSDKAQRNSGLSDMLGDDVSLWASYENIGFIPLY